MTIEEEDKLFQLTDKQREAARVWFVNHDCPRRHDAIGVINGRYTYCFTPTGLGMIETIKCWCGEELNLTDFNNW